MTEKKTCCMNCGEPRDIKSRGVCGTCYQSLRKIVLSGVTAKSKVERLAQIEAGYASLVRRKKIAKRGPMGKPRTVFIL